MTGYRHIVQLEQLKAKCDELGFRMGYSQHGYYNKEYGDIVALFPKDQDALPVYNRDRELSESQTRVQTKRKQCGAAIS